MTSTEPVSNGSRAKGPSSSLFCGAITTAQQARGPFFRTGRRRQRDVRPSRSAHWHALAHRTRLAHRSCSMAHAHAGLYPKLRKRCSEFGDSGVFPSPTREGWPAPTSPPHADHVPLTVVRVFVVGVVGVVLPSVSVRCVLSHERCVSLTKTNCACFSGGSPSLATLKISSRPLRGGCGGSRHRPAAPAPRGMQQLISQAHWQAVWAAGRRIAACRFREHVPWPLGREDYLAALSL